jgi:hypothetical protein
MVVPKEYNGKRYSIDISIILRLPSKEIYLMFCIELSRVSISNGLVV